MRWPSSRSASPFSAWRSRRWFTARCRTVMDGGRSCCPDFASSSSEASVLYRDLPGGGNRGVHPDEGIARSSRSRVRLLFRALPARIPVRKPRLQPARQSRGGRNHGARRIHLVLGRGGRAIRAVSERSRDAADVLFARLLHHHGPGHFPSLQPGGSDGDRAGARRDGGRSRCLRAELLRCRFRSALRPARERNAGTVDGDDIDQRLARTPGRRGTVFSGPDALIDAACAPRDRSRSIAGKFGEWANRAVDHRSGTPIAALALATTSAGALIVSWTIRPASSAPMGSTAKPILSASARNALSRSVASKALLRMASRSAGTPGGAM